jgi:inhibitor of cysteine peptidase
VGCAGGRALEADRAYQAGLAPVERIDVQVFPERPVSVHVSVYGQLPDSCTELDRSRQQRLGSSIEVTLTTRRESVPDCSAEPRPYQRRILLDVVGLPAGLYFVDVNGVRESFQIFQDRSVPDPMDRFRTW